MKARPILMHGRSVRALLDGRKTQTRRIVKPQPQGEIDNLPAGDGLIDMKTQRVMYPKGQHGDLLWVRETWVPEHPHWRDKGALVPQHVEYRCDWAGIDDDIRWVPSIHMPRWASRTATSMGISAQATSRHSENCGNTPTAPAPGTATIGSTCSRSMLFTPTSTKCCRG